MKMILNEYRLIAFETEVSQPAANVHGSALIRSRLIIIFVTKRVQFRGVQRGNISALAEPGVHELKGAAGQTHDTHLIVYDRRTK